VPDSDESDHRLASRVADEAGRLLVRSRPSLAELDASSRRDAGDATGQRSIADALAAARPDDPVLSEEADDSTARLTAARVWIVDPLDGTREYAEGRDDWAVHVALWADGDLVAGAVALPGLGLTLGTDDPPVVPDRPADRALRIAVSRSRPPAVVERVADIVGAELVPIGSAGFKVGAVIRGEVDAYIHDGGQYEWDSAAPVAVALAAGLFASRLDGSPLRYNRPDPYLPDLVVCRPELSDTLLAAIAADEARLTAAVPRSTP
jgi:3'(2'), 5'-bisphosphate nucleotidase